MTITALFLKTITMALASMVFVVFSVFLAIAAIFTIGLAVKAWKS